MKNKKVRREKKKKKNYASFIQIDHLQLDGILKYSIEIIAPVQ